MLFPGRMSELDQSKLLEAFPLARGVLLACLRVLNIEKLLLGGRRPAVPRTGAVTSLDAGEELGLVPVDVLLRDPVHPEALVRRRDVAGNHGAARDLGRGTRRQTRSGTGAPRKGAFPEPSHEPSNDVQGQLVENG